MPELHQEASVGELFGRLTQDMGLLIRQEAQLAKIDIQIQLSELGRSGLSLAAGGLLVWLAALALTTTVILLLVNVADLDPWVASLGVGAVLAGLGYVLLRRGLDSLKRIDPTPRRAIESLKEDIQWAKEQTP
ncbi:MAG TPA: phage holin family protein [Gemmatimonadales bacterium]|jgi:uncharacterized membrane protein YqjE